MRYAVIKSTIVINIIELKDPLDWTPPVGTIIVQSDIAQIGDTYDGVNFIPPVKVKTFLSIAENWSTEFVDIIKAREALIVELSLLGGFSFLTLEEKAIAAKWFIVDSVDRLTVISEEQDKENWINFLLEHTKTARDKRIETARRSISYELKTDEATDLYKSLKDFILGYSVANTLDLMQWITNEVGSPYELDGFAQKLYYSDARRDLLVEIISKGNY